MLDNLRRGDKIITGGGIIAEIKKVDDSELSVELTDGVQVKVLRSTVQGLMSKPEPVGEGEEKPKKKGLFG